jgi:hypothetical protein
MFLCAPAAHAAFLGLIESKIEFAIRLHFKTNASIHAFGAKCKVNLQSVCKLAVVPKNKTPRPAFLYRPERDFLDVA